MKDQLEKIEMKLDKLDERFDGMSTTLALNTASLEEHVKRTNLLEERLDPVEKHVAMVNAGMKIIVKCVGAIAALAGLVLLILQIVKELS